MTTSPNRTDRLAALAALLLAGCASGSSGPSGAAADGEPRPAGAPGDVRGTVLYDGKPPAQADVLLLDAAGKVVAIAPVDANGVYTITPPAAWQSGWLLARLYDPILGARAHPFDRRAGGQKDVTIAPKDTVRLSGEAVLPDGVKVDWLELGLTPRSLPGVPEQANLALLAVDTGPSIRGTFVSRKITSFAFDHRVLPGIWELRVDHWVDGGESLNPPPTLTLESVTLDDGTTITPELGGVRIDATRDRRVRATLKKVEER